MNAKVKAILSGVSKVKKKVTQGRKPFNRGPLKFCPHCKEPKPIGDFYGSGKYVRWICKICFLAYKRNWRNEKNT